MPDFPLQPEISRAKSARTFVLLTAFWNIVTYLVFGSFLAAADASDLEGWTGIGIFAFFAVFAVIGLVLAVLAVRSLVILRYAPQPVLSLPVATLPVGSAANLSWHIDGQRRRVQSLALTLEGMEEVIYTSGTDTSTDRHVFHQLSLYDSGAFQPTTEGRNRIFIPADTMWSWSARHNKILWQIRVKMRLHGLPGTDERFRFTVVPAGPVA